MELPASRSEQRSASQAFVFQRLLLAACIILAPLSITIYILAWPENPASVLNDPIAAPIKTSMMAGSTGNMLHFIGAIAASFFLPVGYLAMSLLGMRRAPWLGTISAALSLLGWIPWAALISIDDLAYDIALRGDTTQFSALWTHFNNDPVMVTYLLIYIPCHLLSAILIGIMLGRQRIIPVWAAWAFALTSPLTIPYFIVHIATFRYILRTVICALWIIGAAPAALAMLKHKHDQL
ncbi:hypothetical protein [Dictyobacter aurantiacus]|uniref:DUF4386 domain-containing protein n=1 Tax=Dictyobacter aurantiacus TaxID=1936993 RepID=A0A401ZQD5_9CHLR|nr:hypothetical protein [Dictyobacter aurantiacus]GCE09087.1 hypothetical protein KDAU_64160 [Dictyobacter aurantiacus]